MSTHMKFPLTRRDRHILKLIFEAQGGIGDDVSLGSSRRGSRIYNPVDVPEPQSPAPSSVFLPGNGKMTEDGYEGVSHVDMAPGSVSLGEVSLPPTIPPSVPSEYQFPWPPNTTMGTIYEESIYGQGGEKYEYKYDATPCDIFWSLMSLFAYIFDIGSDILVAYLLFMSEDYIWFGLTLGFVLIPAMMMTLFSFILYIRDWKIVGDKASPCRWASRVIFAVFQLGPFLRLVDTVHYGCASRRADTVGDKQHLFERMVDEDVDATLLRLFEAFMEAAPQTVLQLYILTVNTHASPALIGLQVLSVISSLVTLSMAMVSYHKALRQSNKFKAKMTTPAMAGQFFWRLFTIGTRVIALAMFATHFTYFVFVVVGGHFLVMLVWVIMQNTKFCAVKTVDGSEHHSKACEFVFQVMAAFVHVFCFFNLLEGHTRLRALFFYTITYLENCGLVLAWFIAKSNSLFSHHEDYEASVVGIVMGGFWVGIAFMLIYYKCCHPNTSSLFEDHEAIKWCVKCDSLQLCYDKPEDMVDKKEAVHVDELQRMAPNTTFEKPETIKSFGPRKCVDPNIRTETPHNVSMSSYRAPDVYDSYLRLNTSKRSNNMESTPKSKLNPPIRSAAYREPQTLDSLLSANSTTV